MSRRGGGGGSGAGSRCEFHELHSVDGYTEYRSVHDSSWYVGFNRRGRRLSGRHWAPTSSRRRGGSRRRCRQFLKTNFARAMVVRPSATATSPDLSPIGLRWVADLLRTTTTTTTTTTTMTPSSRRRRHRKSRRQRRRRLQPPTDHHHQQQQQQQTERTT